MQNDCNMLLFQADWNALLTLLENRGLVQF